MTVIVPCFNEEDVLKETDKRLIGALSEIPDCNFEIIYVDDGSRDATLAILQEIHAADDRMRVVSFSRNFGHQNALRAGVMNANGDCIISLDADLQHLRGIHPFRQYAPQEHPTLRPGPLDIGGE